MEKKVHFTFGGVTDAQFEEAIQTVIRYFNGIAAAPINPESEAALIMCGMHGMMLDMAQRNFAQKLKELRDFLEKRKQEEVSSHNN